jgi:hypothetical protein
MADREPAGCPGGPRGRVPAVRRSLDLAVWGHNAKWARADGPLVEGGIVDVRAGYGRTYPCRIRRLVAGHALELEVRPPLMTVINTYEVEPASDGAHIRHALEVSGPLAGITRLIRLDRVYQGWLDKEVGRLVEMAMSTRD